MAITSHAKPALHVSGSDGASTGTEEGGSTRANPYGQLSDQEAAILQRQVEPATVKEITYKALLRFASRQDITIIAISSICAIAAGAAIPLNTVILGSLAGSFQDFVNGLPRAKFDEEVKRQTLFFVYLAIGEFAATYVATVGFTHTGESITRKIREQYLKAVLKQNAAFFDNLGPGEIITRISSDTNVIQEGMSEKIELALSSVSIFAAAYVIGFIKYWKLTLILTVMTPVLFLTLHVLIRFIIKYSKLSLAAYAESGTVVEETLSSIRTVTAFGSQENLAREYNACLTRAGVFGLRMKCVAGSVPGFAICLFNLGYALASWLGSKYIVSGETNMSAVLTILLAVMLGAYSFGKAAQHFQAFGNAVAAAARIYATIDRAPPFSAGNDQGRTLESLEGCIEFRNVKHVYPSRPDIVVLQNLDLVIPAGDTIAITGASGSGKSTIVTLIERFYDPVAGEVLIDGIHIESLNLSWLRRQIGLVSQDPALFSGTVKENILLGLKGTESWQKTDGPAGQTLAEQAARLANAHDFIEQLPQGYDTHVGERGSFLSGGQRQRIAIARAVVSQPRVLIFDEATSALDSKTEGVVQAALEKAARGRTTIIVAHRLSTIKNADSIVVLGAGGEILEQGTYEELIAKQAAFHHLLEAQRMAPKSDQPRDYHLCDEKDHQLESISVNCKALQDLSTSSLEEKSAIRAVDATAASDAQQKISNYSLWSLIKFTASLNRKEWKVMLVGLTASIISGAGEPVQCVILAKCISTLSLPPSQYHRLRSETNFWSGMFFMIAIVMLITCLTMGVSFAYGSERLVRRCRHRAFRAILRQDIQFFDREENSVGALTSFLGVETTHLAGMSAIALGTIFQLIATLVIAYIIALAVGWKLALVCISTVPVILLAGFLNFWTLARFEAYLKDAYRESASYACEATSSTRTIASLTLEDEVCQRYHNLLITQSHKSFRFSLKSGILYAASQSLGFPCMALCFWYGSHLLGDYSMSQFYLVFFTVIFGTRSAANMCSQSNNMAKAKVAASELKTLFDRTPAIDIWSSEGDVLEDMQGSVEFRDVHFAYKQGQPVLNGLSFKVVPGQYIALVGASGCGKSTIISLLERFYDPSSGGVFVDGKDISGLNLSEYRNHLALVSQEPTLYQGTIRENVLIGINDKNVPEDRIVKVCKEANIYDFILSLPTGFDTVVGSKGIMLSGGQKQRVAIARALLRDPKILLLDEATSALDSESESVVQTALDAAARGRTTISVAHRLSTVRNADEIFVVDGGRIVESGTHATLLAQRGRYFELVQLQSVEKQEEQQQQKTL